MDKEGPQTLGMGLAVRVLSNFRLAQGTGHSEGWKSNNCLWAAPTSK